MRNFSQPLINVFAELGRMLCVLRLMSCAPDENSPPDVISTQGVNYTNRTYLVSIGFKVCLRNLLLILLSN